MADAKVVLSPKILIPFYNIHVLVEAMAKVVARESRAHLVLTEYGADPLYRSALLERLEALGLGHAVTLVGHVAHSEMPTMYALADVAVGIPNSDGLPQTLLEAMACGVPSVIGPLDRYSEIVRDGDSALFAQIEPLRAAHAIVSSNTSGIPISALADGRSAEFRRHLLGTHFFNPPRYLRLLEVIPIADTDRGVIERIAWTADHALGKGIVVAKDSPGFIANRIGIFGVALAMRALASGRYTVEEIDAITGPALGRPKSATFRTMDIAGIDVLAHVANNLNVELPPIVAAMSTGRSVTPIGFSRRSKSCARCSATSSRRPIEALVAIHQIQSQKCVSMASSVAGPGSGVGVAFWERSRNRY